MDISRIWTTIRQKHWKLASSSGSLGIIGAIILVVAAILLFWKPFLGGLSKYVAFIMVALIPLLNL